MANPTQPRVAVTRSSGASQTKLGPQNVSGVSAEMCGSRGLWLGMIRVPPGARANAPMHEARETALYVLQGAGEIWIGDELQEHIPFGAGDFVYIPASVPSDPSATDEIVGIAAHTDPNEQKGVVLIPELQRFLDTPSESDE